MKKYLFPLFFILFICSFITSCSSIFSDEDEYGTVSFSLNEAAAKAINSRAASSRDASQEIFSDCKLSVTLYVNDKEQTQEAELSAEGASVKFERIRVGSKVSARVHVYKGDAVIAAGLSESKKITRGENTLNVQLTYAANGNLTFGEHLTLKVTPSAEIWLNKGEFTISLLDENGKDILEDVDWNAFHEETVDWGNGPQTETYYDNQNLLRISAVYRVGHKEIGVNNMPLYNVMTIDNYSVFTKAGKLELTFRVTPQASTYVNKAGKTVPFPYFEPVTTTFEVEVENILGIDVTGMEGTDPFYYAAEDVFNAVPSDGATVKIYGEKADETTHSALFGIIGHFLADSKGLVDLDCSNLTTKASEKKIGNNALDNIDTLHSIIFPRDLEIIGTITARNCDGLESITIPASVTVIEAEAFTGCSNVTQVIFEKTSGWYDSSTYENSVDVTDTATVINLLTNIAANKPLYRKTN